MEIFRLTGVEWDALRLSLWVSAWAVAASLPFGILTAWVLARLSFPGKFLLDALVHLPLVLPPVVTGYVLLVFLGRNGIIGALLYKYLGLAFAFNWKGAVLAAAVMSFPLLVRALRLSLEGVDQGLEAAARTLGAGPVRVFFTITLPLALYTLTQVPDGETGAMRLCIISILVAMGALVCSEILARRFAVRMKG
jgi:molybdate transport system permease protein